ncbi:carbon-nitrogen hydrolase family protein [Labilibacter sediminis]|nr:carbon-nitrogen hydrolase family protein [Labilibacter sediminis]
MIVAAAQTNPFDRDVKLNIEHHCQLIQEASDKGADLVVFPEMSLTGYIREGAQELAFTLKDSRLDKLIALSKKLQITVVAGAPILIDQSLFIGSFILQPDGSVNIYTKQYLHEGEEEFFESSFDYNPVIKIKGHRILLSICADIENPNHPMDASKSGASLYIASIFYTPLGMDNAWSKLSAYANQYCMNILMANFCGSSWGMEAGGRSGFWNTKGELVSGMKESSYLLMAEVKD